MQARHYFLFGLALAVIVTTIFGAVFMNRPYTYQGSQIDPPLQVGDMQLVDQDGNAFSKSALLASGDVSAVLVFFGYTFCPDVCPVTLVEFKQVKAALGDNARYVRFIFVTVDPARDNPERIKKHLAHYDPEFTGLTGDPEALKEVMDDFMVFAAKGPVSEAGHYLVDHTSRVYVLDRNGELGLTYSFGTGADAITADIRQMIKERKD